MVQPGTPKEGQYGVRKGHAVMSTRSFIYMVLASILVTSVTSAQTPSAVGSTLTGGAAMPLAVLAAGQSVSATHTPYAPDFLWDGGWRVPIARPYVEPSPPRAEPAPEDPAAAARETATARRLRLRAHAQTTCERTERDPALRAACIACASRGETYVWLGRNDASVDHLRTLASMLNRPLNDFRCQDRRHRQTVTLINELARRFQDVERRVGVAETQINGLHDAQGPIEPRLIPQLVQLTLAAHLRTHLEGEVTALEARAQACRAGRLDTGAIRTEDRGRPVATVLMMAWSDEQIRAAGYRPRVPDTVRPDCAEMERSAVALRQVFNERIHTGAFPTWERLGGLELPLRRVTEACAAGHSAACAEAQATLSQRLAAH